MARGGTEVGEDADVNVTLTLLGQMGTFGYDLVRYEVPLEPHSCRWTMGQSHRKGLAAAERSAGAKEAEKAAAEALSEAREQAKDILAQATKRADEIVEEANRAARKVV